MFRIYRRFKRRHLDAITIKNETIYLTGYWLAKGK